MSREEKTYYLKQAAQNGYIPAMYDWAMETDDPDERKLYLKQAAENGYIPAMYYWAMETDDPEERRKYLKQAATNGDIAAMHEWAMETDDSEEKKRYLKEAAEDGYIPAMYDWAMETDDLKEREHYVKQAAEEGYIPAMHRYGVSADESTASSRQPDQPFGPRHVFISYVREDWEKVVKLRAALEKKGFVVWQDTKRLLPGTHWKAEIREAIESGDFFLACFSDHYWQRHRTYMNEELSVAVEELRLRPRKQAWFIPVVLSACEIPNLAIGGGETLSDIQRVELFADWGGGIAALIQAITQADRLWATKAIRHQPRKARIIPQTTNEKETREVHLPSVVGERFAVVMKKIIYMSRNKDVELGLIGIDFLVSPSIPRTDFDKVCHAFVPRVMPLLLPISQILGTMYGVRPDDLHLSVPKHRWICDDWRDSCPHIRYDVYFEEPDEIRMVDGVTWLHFEIEDWGFTFQAGQENNVELSDRQKKRLIDFGSEISHAIEEVVHLIWPEGSPKAKAGAPDVQEHGDWGGDALFIRVHPI